MKIKKFIPVSLLAATKAVMASSKSVVSANRGNFFQNNKIAILVALGVIVVGSGMYYYWKNKKK